MKALQEGIMHSFFSSYCGVLCSIIFYCICTRHNRTLECDCGFDMQNTLQSILTMLQFEGSYSPPVLSRAKDGNLGWTQATSSYIFSIKPYINT